MKLELGKEYPEKEEAKNTEAIINVIKHNLAKVYKAAHINRQFHAKMHACVKGIFTIEASLPDHLQTSTFKAGKSYTCWVRFSNGNTKVSDDRKADLRGIAIKLTNVEGEQLTKDKSLPNTHDFLLVSYPTLMAGTIKDFKKSIDAVCNGFSGLLRFVINPFNWGILFRTLASMKKHRNLLAIPYWSVSPYRFGGKDKAVKYKLVPTTSNLIRPDTLHKDFLSAAIATDLTSKNITFDFMIQFQEDADRDLIEDPTKEWHTTFIKIATLTLPQQQFVPADTMVFGDNLTFSPWHCNEAHQPLGAVNRARKATYDAISGYRTAHNLTT